HGRNGQSGQGLNGQGMNGLGMNGQGLNGQGMNGLGLSALGLSGHKSYYGKDASPAVQKAALPLTGDASHPFFTVAALGVIASAGVLALTGKKN
ncbi:TPA: LPXTG cell wall anchor domain-containing protein, partial [Streptococcus equi subsp. zooepidemicus]|nr:LPXTG cell wall anchor domain-containing protein [Streptococcus equi subsp. zooepidemicus]